MRARMALVLGPFVLLAAALSLGCETNLPTPLPPEPPPPPADPLVAEAPPDATPRVVRRLVAESRREVERNRLMAAELRDPRGRARAQAEADALEREIELLAGRVDNADSGNLDDVMSQLQRLDTRIDLLHEKLRAATERTTAVQKD